MSHHESVRRFLVDRKNLIGLMVLVVLAIAYLAPMQNAQVNGFGIIHNEGASFIRLVDQFGWTSALAYLRFTTLVVVGDVLGALCALWLPILVVATAYAAYRYRRCKKQ